LIHQIIKETGRISTSSLCNINIPWAVLHTKRDGKHVVQICMDDHGKNLDDHVYDYGNRFDPRDIITIIRDVANGLLDLGVPHLDIKPQNILWNKNKAVLCDFGMSHGPIESTSSDPFTCTFITRAPEILDSQNHGSESDLWSLGVTTSWLLSHRYLLGAGLSRNIKQLPDHITKWESTEARNITYKEIKSLCSENSLRALLSTNDAIPFGIAFAVLSLCQLDPKKRISLKSLLNTPWLRSDLLIKRKRTKTLPLYVPVSKTYTTSLAWVGLDNECSYLLKPVDNLPPCTSIEVKNRRGEILSYAWTQLKRICVPTCRDWISVIDAFDRLATESVLINNSIAKIMCVSVYIILLAKQHNGQLFTLETVASKFFSSDELADLLDGVWSALHQLQYQLFTPNVNTWFCSKQCTDKDIWRRVLDAYAGSWPNGTTSRHGLLDICKTTAHSKFAWISKEKEEILSSV
jgi:serine/threonine protein kinase